MRKIFISDLHIGDGSIKDDFKFDEDLIRFLKDTLNDDSELVIVGDFLELLENRVVQEMGLIPFNDLILSLDERIIQSIYRSHEKLFNTMRKLNRRVKIKYIVGNHDYYILVNKKVQNALKQMIENVEILPMMYDNDLNILVIHGNQFDVVNRFTFDKKRKRIIPPLGDYMTRYFMTEFEGKLKNIPREVGEYDNVKPFFEIDKWFEHIMQIYDFGFNILEVWMKTVFDMFKSDEFRAWIQANFPRSHWVSKLFLNRSGGMELGRFMSRIALRFKRLINSDYIMKKAKKILMKNAKLEERELIGYSISPNVDYKNMIGIIAGHTHVRKFKLFRDFSRWKLKFYSNCGSWKPQLERRKNGFVKTVEFGYTMIEKRKDEITVEHGGFGRKSEKILISLNL